MTTIATPGVQRKTDVPTAGPRPKRNLSATLGGVAAWVIGLIFIAPVLYMVLTSFHHQQDAVASKPRWGAALTWTNYHSLFTGPNNIKKPLLQSVEASVISTLLVLALAIPAAYALSIRPVRKWTDTMFFFLSTKMLPPIAGTLPIYLFATKVTHLDDTVILLIVLYTSMNLPIAVWMMRSFLAEVPPAIIEAASIDGASTLNIMRKIVAPIAAPGIAATSLICFIFAWNEQLFANVLGGTNVKTAPIFVNSLQANEGSGYLAVLCAGTIVVSLPVLIAGFSAQDKLVQGLSLGAVK